MLKFLILYLCVLNIAVGLKIQRKRHWGHPKSERSHKTQFEPPANSDSISQEEIPKELLKHMRSLLKNTRNHGNLDRAASLLREIHSGTAKFAKKADKNSGHGGSSAGSAFDPESIAKAMDMAASLQNNLHALTHPITAVETAINQMESSLHRLTAGEEPEVTPLHHHTTAAVDESTTWSPKLRNPKAHRNDDRNFADYETPYDTIIGQIPGTKEPYNFHPDIDNDDHETTFKNQDNFYPSYMPYTNYENHGLYH